MTSRPLPSVAPVLSASILVAVLFVTPVLAQTATVLTTRTSAGGQATIGGPVLRQQSLSLAAPLDTLAAPAHETLILDLFADVRLVAHRDAFELLDRGVTWIGAVEGYPGSSVVLVSHGEAFVGHVTVPFGFFRIQQPAPGGLVVQQIDQSRFAPGPDDVVVPDESLLQGATAHPEALVGDDRVIDVLVAMTHEARDAYANEDAALASVFLVMAETNLAFSRSRIDARARLAHVATIPYAESGDMAIDLARLQRRNDGLMDEVHTLRDEHAADIVMLVTRRDNSEFCGRAFLGTRSLPDLAFGIVQQHCMNSGLTFVHELGHLLGAHHDWYVNEHPGLSVSSKGYVSVEGRFLTVMAYYDRCRDLNLQCTWLVQFSNPHVERQSRPMGVPAGSDASCRKGDLHHPECDADNAHTVRTMAPVVARYRDSRSSVVVRQILPGHARVSDSGRYHLTYQVDGNLVLYDDQTRTALWSSGTSGTSSGETLMQLDGNLVIYDASGTPVWSSGTPGHPGAYLEVGDDGVVVIYDSDGKSIWRTRP